jgi:hypothetical protein
MSTLALTVGELRQEIQRYFGFGRNAQWSSIQVDAQGDVLSAINRGLRQFYSPMPMPNESSAHEWSFLRGFGNLSTIAPQSTGTVAITAGSVGVSGTDTAFTLAIVGQLFKCNNETREITASASPISLTIDREMAAVVSAGTTYEILGVSYDLPADFGGLKGQVTFDDGEGYAPLQLVNESAIRHRRSQQTALKGAPEYAAVVPKTVATGTASEQAYKMLVWPIPDKVYDLTFAYTVMTNRLYTGSSPVEMATSDAYYPVGSMIHGETLLASCLAVAEQMMDEFNNPGKMHGKYMERLAASISYDRRTAFPDGFGYNFDNSDQATTILPRRRIQNVSFNNNTYPS